MRTLLALVVTLAILAVWWAVAPPRAQSQISAVRADVNVDRQGWFWRDNTRVNVPGTGVQQEAFPAPAQKHHLQVALDAGEDDKRAFVGFDLTPLSRFPGSTIRSFTLTLAVSPPTGEHTETHVVDAEESQNAFVPPATSNDAGAKLVACPVTSFLADGADGDPVETPEGDRIEPQFDCERASAEGVRRDDGLMWTFDLAQVAQLWADGVFSDTAVVIKPAPDPPQPPSAESTWTVEIHGRQLQGLTARTSYTPPAPPGPVGDTSEEMVVFEQSPTGFAPAPPPPPLVEGEVSANEPEGTEGQVQARTFVPDPRFPWYMGLPVPAGALALAYVWYLLRQETVAPAGPTHRVSERLRARRGAER